MVGPLENGVVVVPVSINDKGPYLFMIDPDSLVSSVDSMLADELDLYPAGQDEILDESDTRRKVGLAEVRKITMGTLSVTNRTVRVHPTNTFSFGGRLVRGLLGRDVIADSLILSIDRDRGVVYLGTQGHLDPPQNAVELKARHFEGRFIVDAKINKAHSVDLHVDIGAPWTMIWESKMEAAKLPRIRIHTTLRDEVGTARDVDSGAMVAKLDVGSVSANGIMLLPFGDRRMRERDLDGAIGQNLLSQYNVTLNWHAKRTWLKPRVQDMGELAASRLRRWGPSFDKCKTPACVEIAVHGRPAPAPEAPEAAAPAPEAPEATAAPDAEAPEAAAAPDAEAPAEPEPIAKPAPPEPFSLEFTREEWTRDLAYEVVVEAVNTDNTPVGLPLIRVTFPQGAMSVIVDRGFEMYQGAALFRVVDVSPFPRDCETGAGGTLCAWQLQRLR